MKDNISRYDDTKTEMLIDIKGGIGIFLAIGGIRVGGIGFLLLVVIPLILSITFIKFKHPVCGILYTIMFIGVRSNLIFGLQGSMLAYIMVLALLIFFIYVDYRSCIKWKEDRYLKKKEPEEDDPYPYA